RAGMLAMTVRAFLRAPRRPVLFQPIYIGYEKLMEGRSYSGELSGQKKEKESWWNLLRGLRVLRQHYGRVALNFGEQVALTPLLDAAAPNWREDALKPDERPEWLPQLIDTLSRRIQVEVNRAADVNPINLLSVALLATPKHAMAEPDLLAQIDLMKSLLEALPYSPRTTLTPLSAAEIIGYGEQMGWIRRVRHPLGDVLAAEGEQAILLSYFRNNVLHLFAASAWVACCFANNRRIARGSVLRLARLIHPFIQSELFLPWDEDGFVQRVDETADFLIARGLLGTRGDGRILQRASGQEDDGFQLRLLAHSLLQAFERYYIAIAALVKNGPGTLSAAELENLCHLTAQRLSLLCERRVIRTDDNGKLDFDAALEEVARDARVILAREVRDSILKITPEVVA